MPPPTSHNQASNIAQQLAWWQVTEQEKIILNEPGPPIRSAAPYKNFGILLDRAQDFIHNQCSNKRISTTL